MCLSDQKFYASFNARHFLKLTNHLLLAEVCQSFQIFNNKLVIKFIKAFVALFSFMQKVDILMYTMH